MKLLPRRTRVRGLRVGFPTSAAALLALAACSPAPAADAADADEADTSRDATGQEAMNTLTPVEEAEGWELLFDGDALDGWRGFGRDDLPEGWIAEDGLLVRSSGQGDIITREVFRDFELSLEWMVRKAGNSGVFYRASEEVGRIFEGAPEMQVLDDAGHVDGENPLTSAGANYGLHPAPRGVVHPAGEWNQARIRVQGNRVTHWLNGERIVEYELGSEEWAQRVAGSKFAEWPEYGTFDAGHIGLQDHGDWVAYRNLKIRRLD